MLEFLGILWTYSLITVLIISVLILIFGIEYLKFKEANEHAEDLSERLPEAR